MKAFYWSRRVTDQYSEDPSVSGMLRSRSLARQSGEYPTPPQQDEFPYQPGDFQRSRPQMKRTGVGESLNNFYQGVLDRDEQGVPQGSDLTTALAVAPGPGNLIARAPNVMKGALASYYGMAGMDAAGSADDPKAVMNLQMKLRDAGFYRGDIDGKMGPGTQRANDAFMAAEKTRTDQENKTRELNAQEGANATALETARANKATAEAAAKETERKRLEDEATLARKTAGDERMRDIEKNLSPMSRAIRDYSAPIGVTAGLVGGSMARAGTQKFFNKLARDSATAGNEIMSTALPTTGKKGVDAGLARAARVNEFSRAGGAKEEPFAQTPNKAPGFEVNPKATPLKDTYNPQVPLVSEAAGIAPFVAEEETSRHFKGKYEEELAHAQAAVNSDPSETNIQHLQKVTDNLAIATGMQRFGQMGMIPQAVGAVGSRAVMPKVKSFRPDMAAAETEQMSLQKMLREHADKTVTAGKKTKAEKPGLGMPANKQPAAGIPPAGTGPAAYMARTLHNY